MNKVIRDGRTAVLISKGYGSGWASWNSDCENIAFDPRIVALVERGASAEEIEQEAEKIWPHGYFGGADGLTIEWVPVGTAFEINEYDGYESIKPADREWLIA